MESTEIILIALAITAFGLVSGKLDGTPLTAPMIFIVLGLAAAWAGEFDGMFDVEIVQVLMSVTLALVLFSDASRIDLAQLNRSWAWPFRMLSIGLVLVIGFGTAAAYWILPGILLTEALIVAVVLAPTDAALGAAVVNDERVPRSIRQTLNIESGLNDGLALPLLAIALALAESEVSSLGTGYWIQFALEEIGIGIAVGIAVGGGLGWLIKTSANAGWMSPLYLKIAGITLALLAFFAADELGGSGFVAAFIAGAAFGIVAREVCEPVHDFAEAEGQGLVLIVFVLYGAIILPDALELSDWRMWVYALLSLTVIRMVPIALSLIGTHLSLRTIGFLGWFGPRGLASMLFMLLVVGQASEIINTPSIQAVVGVTVLCSVMLHGLTSAPAAASYGHYAKTAPDRDLIEEMDVTDLPTKTTYGMEM